MIHNYFETLHGYEKFEIFDNISPVVSVENNFDRLLISPDHPSRSKSDTYYVSEDFVLRTHTSAHQYELLSTGHNNFLVTGDVYRKDEVNNIHYYVFHQMEGLAKVPDGKEPLAELQAVLSGLVEHLFPGCEYRFYSQMFPFTHPSLEVEVQFDGKWLEILGCGVTHEKIIKDSGREGTWWAFGIGLERICMILFGIKDIRYFWSRDSRFYDQFIDNKVVKFKEFSHLPSETKAVSFWIDSGLIDGVWNMELDFMELIRSVGGDWIESVKLKDTYTDKNGRCSRCYEIKFLPIDPSLTCPGKFKQTCINMMDTIVDGLQDYDIVIR